MISSLDESIREIFETLHSQGLWENTLVVFSSDNGAAIDKDLMGSNHPLRGGKSRDWEGGIRLPAFVTGGLLHPSKRGLRTNKLMHATDWFPTFAEGARITPTNDKALDGHSFWPFLTSKTNEKGNKYSIRKKIVFTARKKMAWVLGTKLSGVIRKGDWKLHFGYYGKLRKNNIKDWKGRWHPLPDQSSILSTPTVQCAKNDTSVPSTCVHMAEKSFPLSLPRVF